jgi:NDP-sugar pyrophosphorylase family protein
MKAIILAGGMGIRLRPFTFSIPKPLLPIGEKPILEIIIRSLKNFGFEEFILAIGYKAKMVEAYFGDGSEFGVRVHYLIENKSCGTAGPLVQFKNSFKFAKEESFLLMNGDILTNLDFSRMVSHHKRNKFEITVGVKKLKERQSYGFVETKDGFLKKIVEKPSLDRVVNAGIYIVKASSVNEIPRNRFFTMPDLINKLISKDKNVGAYDIKEYWLGLENLRHFEDVYNNKRIRRQLMKS